MTAGLPSFLEEYANRRLLEYAAGRIMYCPGCERLLDCRRTTITSTTMPETGTKVSLVRCTKCFDAADACGSIEAGTDVVDGRLLFGRSLTATMLAALRAMAASCDAQGGSCASEFIEANTSKSAMRTLQALASRGLIREAMDAATSRPRVRVMRAGREILRRAGGAS